MLYNIFKYYITLLKTKYEHTQIKYYITLLKTKYEHTQI